jgi:hypothetical protein
MKHNLSFVEFHSPLFSQGVNLGTKVSIAQRQAQAVWDDEKGVIWLFFKGKASCLPVTSALSWDMITIPDEMKTLFGIVSTNKEPEIVEGPPFARKRGRPAAEPTVEYDINDYSQEAQRARARAASANSHKAVVTAQNDALIQQARNQAAGMKISAQVSNPTMPTEGVTGKPKAISHAGMKVQIAQEMKE